MDNGLEWFRKVANALRRRRGINCVTPGSPFLILCFDRIGKNHSVDTIK